MKARFVVIGLAALVSVPFLGCSSGDSSDPAREGAEVDDLGGKADGISKPVGTYQFSAEGGVGFSRLVLMTDKTFHSERTMICVTMPCDPLGADGTYKLTKSTTSSKKYLRLSSGGVVTRYEYKVTSNGTLELRADGTTAWTEMTKAQDSWCKAASQCAVQGLQPKDPGEWECESNVCSYSSSSPVLTCEDAGGNCVPLSQNACPDGVVGDANEYSCGGGLGIMCCLPKLACEYLDSEIYLVDCGAAHRYLRHWTDLNSNPSCTGYWTMSGSTQEYKTKADALGSQSCNTTCLRVATISVSLLKCGVKKGYIVYHSEACGDLLETPDGFFSSEEEWNTQIPCP